MGLRKLVRVLLLSVPLVMGMAASLYAQIEEEDEDVIKPVKDTLPPRYGIDSFILKRRGLIGKLARNLLTDTIAENVAALTPVRNDLLFSIYKGRVIRSVRVEQLDFGTPITDTSRKFRNRLTRLANNFHRNTRGYVVRNNLFFKKGDKLEPYLLADNERHLRDQPYLQDARISVRTADNSYDSVDVVVYTKDVLSLGGTFHMRNTTSVDMSVRDDNLGGWGDRLQGSVLYDQQRLEKVGYGMEFIKRNIAGTFIDGVGGFKNFADALNSGRDEERNFYVRFLKPLVNPYMRFTYALELATHTSRNMYLTDSLYKEDFVYDYFNYDAWLGWNTGAFKLKLLSGLNEDDRLRTLLSMRVMRKQFQEIPDKYVREYDARYTDVTGVIGSISIFGQNFYKTRYIYGFGRNEDVPEGVDLSLTGGWTKVQGIERPYLGLDLQRNFFTASEQYFNYTFRIGAYWRDKKPEDMDVLFNLDYFSPLRTMGPRWKQRTFISAGITGQVNKKLNEELYLESQFGLPELRNDRNIGGDIRATLKAESVFFSPLNIINFRFAPFVFTNLCVINPTDQGLKKSDLYSSLGAGLRARNEALIFGTLELKAHYFPRANYFGERWRIDFNTNIKFKYNRQIIKRPELILVN
ncbi:MAG: hypothetical protein P0Y53_11585 [Candidatus Pseudobacter hemicellulosilyticus]|uniref:Uncharacterized protein n=1 Tax=Candidatus Pseudobacter hemicellulosilyticus TaxID=3121375 RepID=A0AAJ5WX36_9BACT|nr:MAG: hypothetical protein P0Y53_11585 [Pseudobacter sp.]